MSGGSFHYLYQADPAVMLESRREDLANMVSALTELGAQDAARETETILLILTHFETRMEARIARLAPVWKAVEWYRSADSSIEAVTKALAKYREEVEPR